MDANREVRTHHQRLLRNLDAHGEVLSLLKMQCDRDNPEIEQVHEAAYFFLQKFCENNKENQTVLNRHVAFFVDQVQVLHPTLTVNCQTNPLQNRASLFRIAYEMQYRYFNLPPPSLFSVTYSYSKLL